ncbi:uncharacterized protein LOC118997546 isoform X2 [Sturnira hondurensis]|uniref:uncharacterized protein LOC118997546 isoform X2 n=1 Tax=Sturnira hondurensis TaxID=192404 RepID=UPI00187A54F2|nr:uncharacterized protein LOC118997546 isoform X2 [Sturnira hondurensis]
MANLQQFEGNRSRTTGQSSNQNPCKFVRLKQSSHTWGRGAPPPSLRLADRKKKVEEPAFEFVPDGRGAQNVATSALGPRLGVQSSPAAPRAASAPAACPDAGPLLHHSAQRGGSSYSKDDSTGVSFLDLVHEAAAATNVTVAAGEGRRHSLHIGRGARAVPDSLPWWLQLRCSLRWRSGKTPPPPSTTVAAAHGARPATVEANAHTARPRRRPAHTAGPAVGPSPRASLSSPGLHEPL